jgi:FkbM family methyltransferase
MPDALGQTIEYELLSKVIAVFGDAVVIDVGAEKGGFVSLATTAGAKAVHAFEPLKRHFDALRTGWEDDSRVNLHRCAISGKSGYATLHIATDCDGRVLDHHHSLTTIEGADRLHFTLMETVETLTVEDASIRFGFADRIDVLKIDTEGHDLAVLEGLGRLRPRVVACEFWGNIPETSGRCPYRLEDLVARGRDLGYEHCFGVSHLDGYSWIDIHPETLISERQWGNLIMVREDAWHAILNGPLSETIASLNVTHLAMHQINAQALREKESVITELAAAAAERLTLIQQLSGTSALTADLEG